jgi:hypothetical protein
VEEKVKDVIEQLIKMHEAQPLLNYYNEIKFKNHLNTLSDNVDEVLERQKRSRTDYVRHQPGYAPARGIYQVQGRLI